MSNYIEKILFNYLSRTTLKDDKEKYLFLYIFASSIYAIMIHVFLFLYYCAVGIEMFMLINVFSVMTYVLACRVVRRGFYAAGAFLMTGEVAIYVILSTIFIGFEVYTILYLFLVLVLQLMTPYAHTRIRIIVGIFVWIISVLVMCLGYWGKPLMPGEGNHVVLTAFNIQVAMLGLLALQVTANTINRTIEKFNQDLITKYKNDANIDALTGLPNRREAELLGQAVQSSDESWYVAMLDIDNFKRINDENGHAVGDVVLVEIAKTMRATIRKTDVTFRWGGEEFLICLRNVNKEEAFSIFESVRIAIEKKRIKTEKKVLKVTVTMGASKLDTNELEESIKRSDALLYYGKEHGKNQVVMQ